MILTLQERLAILSILPSQGDFVTLKVLDKLRMSVALTEKEIEDWGVEQDLEAGNVKWKENGEAEIPIGELGTGIIIDSLRNLDKSKQLSIDHFSIYKKFVPTIE